LDFLKSKYNVLLNTDVVIREFSMFALNKSFKCFIIYIDGLVDTNSINDFILKALMMGKHEYNQNANKGICTFVDNCLLPQNSVDKVNKFEDVFSGINMGNCLLFIDTLNIAFNIDVKSYKQRSIDTSNNESVIKGPQEAFVENFRTNTSLIRRIVNNENLIIENLTVGKLSKTKCGICYIQNIANGDLVSEVKYRISSLDIDSLLSTGQLEQLIEEDHGFGIPQILSTERPDKCTKYLFQGRVVVLVNGNPYAMIMPATAEDFLFSPEDTNLRPIFANFLRSLRVMAAMLTLLLPGIYMAITSFHQEILPTELLFSILAARENVPFPIIFELLLMEFSFELIREAGLRVPSPIGSTIGIVGALILGDAAVNASIVSPILIIIVAITGISSYAIPDFSFGFHLRVFRFIFILLGVTAGFLGIGAGIFVYITLLCSLKSFGVPYTVPMAPSYNSQGNGYFIPPIWKQQYRASFISPKKTKAQEDISTKWKF
jgi:spore germination protein KA